MIRKYLNPSQPASSVAENLGELRPVEPAARREGLPLLGEGQVYVMKRGAEYHQSWCQTVAHTWDRAPRGLLVAMLAEIGARTPCQECGQLLRAAPASRAQTYQTPHQSQPPDEAIPLRVIGLAHGVLFLAAGPEHRGRLRETAVEPATPLYVDGRREGMVIRLDARRAEPLLVVQLDPRATFRNGPYQARLRHPLRRSATKPFALAFIEPAPEE